MTSEERFVIIGRFMFAIAIALIIMFTYIGIRKKARAATERERAEKIEEIEKKQKAKERALLRKKKLNEHLSYLEVTNMTIHNVECRIFHDGMNVISVESVKPVEWEEF